MSKHDLDDMLKGYHTAPPTPPPATAIAPPASQPSQGPWIIISVIVLLLIAALAYFSYALNKQQKQQLQVFQDHADGTSQALELIEQRLDGNAGQIATLESKVQVTMERVGVTQRELSRAKALAQRLQVEQEQHVATLKQDLQKKADVQKVSQLEQQSSKKFEGVDREITDVKAEVKSTKQDLAGTIAELSNLGVKVNEQGQMIATNANGVAELVRRGERDYVTFELDKNVRTRVAGITLQLRDTDPGNAPDADINIYANDTVMERKDIPQNFAVNFYVGADRIPYELVLNEIFNKPDRCKGYISVPKNKLPTGPPGLASPSK